MNEGRNTTEVEAVRESTLPTYEPPRIQVMTEKRDPQHLPDHAVHGDLVDDVLLLAPRT